MNNILYFKRWNWEADVGEDPIINSNDLPKVYCKVMLDYRGFVFRVVEYGSDDFIVIDSDNNEITVYDYYCDDNGNVLEKRSLDDGGNIIIIIQSEYSNGNKVAEIAWNPNANEDPRRITV